MKLGTRLRESAEVVDAKTAGYKMYALLALGAVVVLANHFLGSIPGVDLDPNAWIDDLFKLAVIAFGRSAVKKLEPTGVSSLTSKRD